MHRIVKKRHLIAARQVSLDGRSDRVTALCCVIPTVCEPVFCLRKTAPKCHPNNKKRKQPQGPFSSFMEDADNMDTIRNRYKKRYIL